MEVRDDLERLWSLESYPNSMKREEVKRLGAVYTPPEIVGYILDAVGYRVDREIEGGFLIDPACGSGNFLTEAVNRLVERLRRIGLDLNDPEKAMVALETVSSHIYGVDVDPRACQMAKLALRHSLRNLYTKVEEIGETAEVSNNIKCLDALTLIGRRLDRISSDTQSFNYVVGNPPYIRLENIPREKRKIYKNLYRSASGRFDISVLFLELGIDLLCHDGHLGYITMNRFMLTDYGRKIRELLLEKSSIQQIIDFNGSRVFEEVTNYPCILVLKRGKGRGTFKVVRVYKQKSLDKIREKFFLQNFYDQSMEVFQTEQGTLTGDPWLIMPGKVRGIFEKIRKSGTTLNKMTSRIGVGTASGLDRVFVIPEEKGSILEEELIKPAVKGEDVRRWDIQWQGLYLIVPYLKRNGRTKPVDISQYPQTERYLEQHREALEKRYCVRNGKKWYELHDSVDPSMSTRIKIVTPDISDCNNFALDRGIYHCLHTCYFIYSNINPEYLLGLLNSQVLEFYFKMMSPRLSGGYYRYVTQYLERLPIAEANSSQFKEIVKAVERKDEKVLNDVVCQIYNISPNEFKTIKRCLKRLGS